MDTINLFVDHQSKIDENMKDFLKGRQNTIMAMTAENCKAIELITEFIMK